MPADGQIPPSALTTLLKATVHATKTLKTFGDFFGRDLELLRVVERHEAPVAVAEPGDAP